MKHANLLLVEDDPAYHVLVPDILSDDGHTVDVASNSADALAYIASVAAGERACHGVILDYHFDTDLSDSGDNATVVMQGIREQLGPEMPVIGFSSCAMQQFGITDLYADVTKDGVADLPLVVAAIPEPWQS